jgi:hypothetical protein
MVPLALIALVSDTAGQPDVGVWEADGYTLGGGFWGGGVLAVEYGICLAAVLRGA